MITPRTTRLVRVSGSRRLSGALCGLAATPDPLALRDVLLVLPTRAAAQQVRRACEAGLGEGAAALVPTMVTRAELTVTLARRVPGMPLPLSGLERDVLMGAAARAAAAEGVTPPFRVRAGLVAAMVTFYDGLRRLGPSVDAFERLTAGTLEPAAGIDRGAERLLRQTRFLAAAFRHFERLQGATGRADEHALRERTREAQAPRPWRHVIVACRDVQASALGLWPADFDLLTRLPGLERLDVVVSDTVLAGELHERLRRWLPGAEEVHTGGEDDGPPEADGGHRQAPLLLPPQPPGHTGPAPRVHISRDREEEVRDFARRVKVQVAPRDGDAVPLDRVALVVRRPLPYVYLTREVLTRAGVPVQLADALPLAAEPFAATLDLVASAVAAAWSRATLVAVLGSPLFAFGDGPDAFAMGRFDRALHEAGYSGGGEPLEALVARWAAEVPDTDEPAGDGPPRRRRDVELAAARVALAVMAELGPLSGDAPAAEHLARLRAFLSRHTRAGGPPDVAARAARARGAVLNGLAELERAFRAHDPTPVPFAEVDAVVRQWVEGHTFAPRAGEGGVHLVDAESAVFGAFEDVQVAGLVEGEWPQRMPPGIFYPASLLRDLGWPTDADRLAGERALLEDLLALPRRRLVASAFHLEDDALVSLSPYAELLDALPGEDGPAFAGVRVGTDEALLGATPLVPDGSEARQGWLDRRLARLAAQAARPSDPPVVTMRPFSVSALERFQDCPFKFFASEILKIDEPPEDQSLLTPKARGTLLHRVLQQFFDEWDRTGRRITPSGLAEARAHLGRVVDEALATLPAADAALERARFFGSPVAPGIIDILLRVEAGRTEPVDRRLLETRMEGEFSLGSPGRRLALRGVIDRVDVLPGRRLRVIDYKTKALSDRANKVQAAVYALVAAERLEAADGGGPWTVDEAAYVAFEGKPLVYAKVKPGAKDAGEILAEVRDRVFGIIDRVAAGDFPVQPRSLLTCRFCGYGPVCRKDYVGDE